MEWKEIAEEFDKGVETKEVLSKMSNPQRAALVVADTVGVEAVPLIVRLTNKEKSLDEVNDILRSLNSPVKFAEYISGYFSDEDLESLASSYIHAQKMMDMLNQVGQHQE